MGDSPRNDSSQRSNDRKPGPLGSNAIWYLAGVGILTVVLISLLTKGSQKEIGYGDFLRLVELGNSANQDEPKSISIEQGTESARQSIEYSKLSDKDLVIGPHRITGRVTRHVVNDGKGETDEPHEVSFFTDRYGVAQDNGELVRVLRDNGFEHFRADRAENRWNSYFAMLGVTALVLLFLFIMMRRLGGAGSPMAFARSRGKMYAQEDVGVTFEDVAGIDEAVEELREVVEFLRTPEKYQMLGGRIPKGVLLVGPPGTGKTLLAKAIAGEAGVPFFGLSGSDFVEMFVGVGAARVRDMFQQAESKSPCIIFIDELDALGKTRGSSMVGGNDEREQTLNALLVEMDGFDTNNGVIVLAATNRRKRLIPRCSARGDSIAMCWSIVPISSDGRIFSRYMPKT